MKLSEETKQKIIEILDLKEFKSTPYDGFDPEKKKALGQYYTSGKVCVKMIERFNYDSLVGKTILDPTCGSENLLIACLIAGADSYKVFGNEYDEAAVKLCRKRLNKACDILGKPRINDWQIHRGNALIKDCLTVFNHEYDNTILPKLLKRRWGMSGGWIDNLEHYDEAEQGNLFDELF